MYEFDLSQMKKTQPIPLDFGGKNPSGEELSIDSVCMKKDGKPWLPICGEFQFSRYSDSEWEKSLLKMKAGGIEIVGFYIFWIHHEEEEGIFRFDGCRNIRKFVETAKKVGLKVFPRVGPWCTGECKNGGFPDWVLNLPDVDKSKHGYTNNFMAALRRYMSKLYEQLEGLMYKDGGPIIGMQLDNEYSIPRAPSIENGVKYLDEFKKMVREIGFDIPYYTRTGWGKAIVSGDNLLPMYGAYSTDPWRNDLIETASYRRFLIIDERLSDSIKLSVEANFTEKDFEKILPKDTAELYRRIKEMKPTPFLSTELGAGIQVSEHRRCVIEEHDIEALTISFLGRGVNMLGYYIYHGGTHPTGKFGTLESTNNGVMKQAYPKKSYDWQAAISESTLLNPWYHDLKSRLLMVQTFTEILPLCETYYPECNATKEKDLVSPRFSIRYNPENEAGFIFFTNHLKHSSLPQRKYDITIKTKSSSVKIPTVRLLDHEMKIIPFNLPLGDAKLVSTNAEPLTKIGDTYFFFTNEKPYYNLEGKANIVTLSKNEATYAYKFNDMLYVSKEIMYDEYGKIVLESMNPKESIVLIDKNGKREARSYCSAEIAQPEVKFSLIKENSEEKTYSVDLSQMITDNVEDIILTTDYIGDLAELYIDGEIFSDWYTNGKPYYISLKRFGYPKKITALIKKSADPETRYYELPVEYGCELKKMTLSTMYKKEIK